MKARQALTGSILLCEESNRANRRLFTVVEWINRDDRGASSLCYEAYHDGSGRGVLKEFYPRKLRGLRRDGEGQLTCGDGEAEAFRAAKRAYVEPYRMLMYEKRNGENRDLATFIPAFEIYCGCGWDGGDAGSVYIWIPHPPVETFEELCEEIHGAPEDGAERKLATVLQAIDSLAKCILALHGANLVHRDIKPSNFGFTKRGGETLTQSLTMFDMDTIRSVYSGFDEVVGTEGFMEPEARSCAPDNQTDIYSIGATLFHAIVVTDEARDGAFLYRSEFYDRLQEMVDSSRLIRSSRANSHPKLRSQLTRILRNCLCDRAHRYERCEQLIDDLERALYYALPAGMEGKGAPAEAWALTDAGPGVDAEREQGARRAIQFHLCERPLYQCAPEDAPNVNVWVAGFGRYGQMFLDACLQCGQMWNKALNVTVVAFDARDRAGYLEARPELARFFDIDGSLAGDAGSFGSVAFRGIPSAGEGASEGEILDWMDGRLGAGRPHYVFIALGEDSLNLSAARACREAADGRGLSCLVCYVREREEGFEGGEDGLCPVRVGADIRQTPLRAEIERMAFNTHLVWEKNLNVDFQRIRADFRKPYNRESSVSSVLSIQYKLHSVGIELAESGFEGAAAEFRRRMDDGARDRLMCDEHRRWVAEKLCQGWRGMCSLDDCARGSTKDEANRRHVCILRSRPDQKLARDFRLSEWDTATEEELAGLDALDRMSVELHRKYAERARESKRRNLLSGGAIEAIWSLIEGDRGSVAAFQEWFACAKDIWNGDTERVRMYEGLKNSFLRAAQSLPAERGEAVRSQVKAFEAVFRPVRKSMEYRVWKADDVAFVDAIPFILTYTDDSCLVVPFAAGGNSEVFGNVAAATAVNPGQIFYLYLIEREEDVRALLRTIPAVAAFLRKRKLRANVELILACAEAAAPRAGAALCEQVRGASGGRIQRVKRISRPELRDLPAALETYFQRSSARRRFFAIERNATGFSRMLQAAGFYDAFPNYRFDSMRAKFEDVAGCGMLTHIHKKPFLSVADMIALRPSSAGSGNPPEFYLQYRALWERYRRDSGAWMALCDILSAYSQEHDAIASFDGKRPREGEGAARQYLYAVPSACIRSVTEILSALKRNGIAEAESGVIDCAASSCRFVIADRRGYREEYDRLFSNVAALAVPGAISAHLDAAKREVTLRFDDLAVRGVRIGGGRAPEVRALLKFFEGIQFILNLEEAPDGRFSFAYASTQIKGLLTTRERLLEAYVFHRAKELGEFDDVVGGCEIGMEGENERSRFACILTRGFRSLFVECRARPEVQRELCSRIAERTERFGVNATAVLIVDAGAERLSAAQRQCGDGGNVVTVWRPEEIDDIGRTLLDIARGDYAGREA